MRVIFLGTNGWYNTSLANTSCVLVETASAWVIFDAGDGLYKLDRYIRDEKPIYLFIGHYHLDHIAGLHTLDKFRFKQGLTICGQPGMTADLNAIMRRPYTISFDEVHYAITLKDLDEGLFDDGTITVDCRFMLHSTPSMGYRLIADDKSLAYCADTGLCEGAFDLAHNVDIALCECSLLPGQKNDDWPHLSPDMAAELAREAAAKKLVLTHFNAFLYPTNEKRQSAGVRAKKIFPNTVIAKDDLEIVL